jgi:hypothetical protein
MSIDRGPEPAAQPLEAWEAYGVWSAEFILNSPKNTDGTPMIDVPQLWMVALDPIAILDRAATAEIEDPRPICGFSMTSDSHCNRPQWHTGDHMGPIPPFGGPIP